LLKEAMAKLSRRLRTLPQIPLAYHIDKPPLTASVSPVTYDASSDAR
jgi:hypothetical protein